MLPEQTHACVVNRQGSSFLPTPSVGAQAPHPTDQHSTQCNTLVCLQQPHNRTHGRILLQQLLPLRCGAVSNTQFGCLGACRLRRLRLEPPIARRSRGWPCALHSASSARLDVAAMLPACCGLLAVQHTRGPS